MVKIDVEGSELEVLKGAETLLQRAAPVLFVATHGHKLRTGSVDFLRARDYAVEGLSGEAPGDAAELVATPRSPTRRA